MAASLCGNSCALFVVVFFFSAISLLTLAVSGRCRCLSDLSCHNCCALANTLRLCTQVQCAKVKCEKHERAVLPSHLDYISSALHCIDVQRLVHRKLTETICCPLTANNPLSRSVHLSLALVAMAAQAL